MFATDCLSAAEQRRLGLTWTRDFSRKSKALEMVIDEYTCRVMQIQINVEGSNRVTAEGHKRNEANQNHVLTRYRSALPRRVH